MRRENATRPAEPEALLIFPCNGNGLEALDCLGESFRFEGFVDDESGKWGPGAHGHPVFSREALNRWPQAKVLAVPGSPVSFPFRRRVIEGLAIEAARFARVIHPRASVSHQAVVGHNVLILAGVVITSNAQVHDHVCLLPNTVVHHDAVVGAWSLVGSNVTIAGGCRVGEGCYIGSGSSLMNGIEIGAGALVGLGSTVVRDVPPGARVAGNPARILS